jgi:hypothetical protein
MTAESSTASDGNYSFTVTIPSQANKTFIVKDVTFDVNLGAYVASDNGVINLTVHLGPFINTFRVYVVMPNVLELNTVTSYIKPGQDAVINMDVKHLMQRVNGCQAMLGYSSTYFPDPVGSVIAAGGGVWDLVIYDSWDVNNGIPGEIDTAVGVDAQGAVGTDADGTVAKITLKAGVIEGITQIVFRADDPDNDTRQTFLSNMNAEAVWPNKYNSQNIVIDGSAPVIDINSAKENFVELLSENGSIANAVQGIVNITITSSDVLSGLAEAPIVTVTPYGGSAETAAFVSENPAGTFNYTWAVTCSTPNATATIAAQVADKSGNTGVATAKHFNVSSTPAGDINGDCHVDFFDFAWLAEQWLNACDSLTWCNDSDINHSGKVDFSDLSILTGNWLNSSL